MKLVIVIKVESNVIYMTDIIFQSYKTNITHLPLFSSANLDLIVLHIFKMSSSSIGTALAFAKQFKHDINIKDKIIKIFIFEFILNLLCVFTSNVLVFLISETILVKYLYFFLGDLQNQLLFTFFLPSL